MAKEKEVTFKDLIDDGVLQIIRAFGKGEDLQGAMWNIVNRATNWGADQAKKEK